MMVALQLITQQRLGPESMSDFLLLIYRLDSKWTSFKKDGCKIAVSQEQELCLHSWYTIKSKLNDKTYNKIHHQYLSLKKTQEVL